MYLNVEQQSQINHIFKEVFSIISSSVLINEVYEAADDYFYKLSDYLDSIRSDIQNFNQIYDSVMDIYNSYVIDLVEIGRETRGQIYTFLPLDFNDLIRYTLENQNDTNQNDTNQGNGNENNSVIYEEDDDKMNDLISSNKDSIKEEFLNVKSCTNPNYITLEDYQETDKPIQIYFPNSIGKFEKSICTTLHELTDYLKTDIKKENNNENTSLKIPSNIMTIYKATKYEDITGKHSFATGKLIVKMPPSNNYITFGSANKIFKNYSKNRTWFALPLFDGKRRRIGNLDEFLGVSSDHGQIKGHIIYKLYTKKQIKSKVLVKESLDDYPEFIYDQTKSLYDILGKRIDNKFIEMFINELVTTVNRNTFKISEFLKYPQKNGVIQFIKSNILVSIKISDTIDIFFESLYDSKFQIKYNGELLKANNNIILKNVNKNNKIKFYN